MGNKSEGRKAIIATLTAAAVVATSCQQLKVDGLGTRVASVVDCVKQRGSWGGGKFPLDENNRVAHVEGARVEVNENSNLIVTASGNVQYFPESRVQVVWPKSDILNIGPTTLTLKYDGEITSYILDCGSNDPRMKIGE